VLSNQYRTRALNRTFCRIRPPLRMRGL
jgi:hypothetical protein